VQTLRNLTFMIAPESYIYDSSTDQTVVNHGYKYFSFQFNHYQTIFLYWVKIYKQKYFYCKSAP